MEDSSANPYIYEQPEEVRQKIFQRKSPLGKVVKIMLIITTVFSLLVGIGLFFLTPLTSVVDQKSREKLANILQPPELTLKRVSVQSDVGFRLSYDNRLFTGYAEVGDSTSGTDESSAVLAGNTYEYNDLRTPRSYNYVRIRPIESVDSSRALQTLPPELELFATMSDAELTEAQKISENKDFSKLSLYVKLDGDKRAEEKITDENTVLDIEATKPVEVTINDVDYQKVRYTTTDENHRITNVKYDDCYYTIRYDQPYSICISNVRPTNVSAASLVEQVFDSITFEAGVASNGQSSESSTDEVSYAYPLARLAQATTTDDDTTAADDAVSDDDTSVSDDGAATTADSTTSESESETDAEATTNTQSADAGELPLITITPRYYGDGDALAAIAKTQPSVVRIGALYCADLTLKFESGATATTLTDACVGNVASGVFISKDGYIATTGHAIRTQKKAAINGYINFAPDRNEMLDRLDRVLDYLQEAKIILETDAEYLSTGASTGDQEALAKIQNIGSIIPDNFITPVKEEYTYAVQLTDKPIVINRSDTYKPSFAYSDTVFEAEYVASEYDAVKAIQEVFGSETPKTDVGLLKVEGSFPDVPIDMNENTQSENTISTIGFTAYTDSSLSINKIRDLPIVTTSKVEQAYEKDGSRLMETDLPVLPGNDGAAVVNNQGKLLGFAVYGLLYCPDQQCFANGTVRANSELLDLLSDNNINLQTGSKIAATWNEAVDQFFRANYAASTASFAAVHEMDRFNRWAEPLKQLSESLEGSEKDTSLLNQLQAVLVVTLIILVSATALLFVAFIIHRRRLNQLLVGHYGAAEQEQPAMQPPSVRPNQPVEPKAPTSIPVQQPPQSQQPNNARPPEDPFYKQ